MKYALVFSLFGGYLLALAAYFGDWAWLLLWPGGSFLLLAGAYAGLGPRLFGKRPDGRLAWWAVVLMLPYLLLTWGAWQIRRLLGREGAGNEIVPGLWVGRRPLARELPPGVGLVIDLTAEFFAARGIAEGREYLCVPTLDAFAPEERALRALADRLAAWEGVVFIHCAAGYGRSATVAGAVLLVRGLAADVRQAEALLQMARPGVRFTPPQRRLLKRLVATHRERS